MSTEVERLRQQLVTMALVAELRAHVDADYAAVMAERHRDRVQLRDDGTPDPTSVHTISAEIVKGADPRWRISSNDEDGASGFYDSLRTRLREVRAREEKTTKERMDALNARFGG